MKLICQTNGHAKSRIARGVIAGSLLLGLLVLFFVAPANLPVPACAFHSLTGHSCLTCGMTRSLHAVLHGNLAASFQYHLFGPAVFLGILLLLLVFSAEAISGRNYSICAAGKTRNRVIGAFAIVWLIYWGIRLAAEFVA